MIRAILTYLKILLQPDNVHILQLIADHDRLISQVRFGARFWNEAGSLEHLQERPRNPDVIAEAHGGA